jgi:cytochrome c5
MAWAGTMFLALALCSTTTLGAEAQGVGAGGGESDLPPRGHSRFDELIGADPVPFPFTRLLKRLDRQLVREPGGLAPLKAVLIPLGRSLQRGAGAPDFFRFPRVVVAVDGATRPGVAPMKDRLFIGYHEKGAVLEVISYNEAVGRFEYQLVRDYRPGGTAEMVYARRALCLACHQNAAPIFARPLWEETPANPAIAARLRATGRDFYGIPIGGTDIAYFFDNATDRANLLPVWQSIWRDGCGDGEGGGACRQALFTAALRLALSGVPPERAELAALSPRLEQRWRQVWPKGLAIPNPDLPNRDPLAAQTDDASTARLPGEFASLPHIPARFEPLNPRPPLEIWQAPDKARLLSGLAGLFADADLDALDQVLAKRSGRTERIDLDCRTRAKAGGRHSFQCRGARVRLAGAFRSTRGGRLRGRLDSFAMPGAPAGISLVQERSAASPSTFQPRHGRRHARLSDGRRLARLAIAQGRGSLTLVDDFAQVNADLPSLRALTTFPAWTGMAELLAALGTIAPRRTPAVLPTPRGEQAVAESAGPVGAFRRRCGQCHDTPEAAPPNFLHGDADAGVAARLAHCAPRIYYRLSMWDVAEARRGKTPMPPLPALAGLDGATWTRSPERRVLLDHARALLLARGIDPADITRRPFESLPACLPAPRLAELSARQGR